MQDINDIADEYLNQIRRRENVYAELSPIRVKYNELCENCDFNRIVHEQLSSMMVVQREVLEKSEELEKLQQPIQDTNELDIKLQQKFDPNIVNQCLINRRDDYTDSSSTYVGHPETPVDTRSSIPHIFTTTESNTNTHTESIDIPLVTAENTATLTNTRSNSSPPMTPAYETPQVTMDNSTPLTNNNTIHPPIDAPEETEETDEFDAGETANIQRKDPIIIPITNDRFVATVCCYENQLLYNDYNQPNRTARLTLIPDLRQPTNKQIIPWNHPEAIVGGGDDEWVHDMAYSHVLRGYLLLNRSRLRLLHYDTHEMEEFYQFPDRSMKRVTCNESFIYLILAGGVTSQNGDEIIVMSYDKEEKVCKTFRDLVQYRNTRITGPIVGEISDIAVNRSGQVAFTYRLELRREVGVCLYNISNTGYEWTSVKQLMLNECWHADLSYTPRVEWCNKLSVFILIEYMTRHLIMIDQNGQVKGETRFAHVGNKRDAPLNLSISSNDWLCVRYESSINIHRLHDPDRL